MQGMGNEFTNKSEYSILQSYEYEYRDVKNDKPYMVFKNALKTDLTVVAFPIKDKPKGYVVILARAEGSPKVKYMPDVDFVVTQNTLTEIQAAITLSKEVEQFIMAHIR
jgi:hypothetical protein